MSNPTAKVPSAASTYTPATLDPDLRSQINTLLLKDDHVTKIQETMLHSLHSHPANWPTAVQSHALSLLRSGDITTFPALVRQVLDDVRQSTQVASLSTNAPGKATNGAAAAAAADVNGKKVNGDVSGRLQGLAIPQAVIDDALKVARESLEAVCEVDENGAS
ncbi:hypothetical protein MAPG_08056 [Magnaporthiopsis poae ATCC 64411]|uniref:Uncharacterized protein n=1 Tax=Magnaporthiopsis poae (strain ATCC 64411 / 73-15) TaxID=644358 RepID=A0A0C4CSI0_MAGP6|nr:hypothetical protein, variant [Magnaporthiopsis poae ATCC 64411]KLU89080.1 hypothetical protein MAPG_08056 [Magnaporthiopsis poae ATCC 64411]